MSVSDGVPVSREFVTDPVSLSVRMSDTKAMGRVVGLVYGLGIVAGVLAGTVLGLGLGGGAMVGLGVGTLLYLAWFGYVWWSSRRRFVIGVSSAGVTVDRRPGEHFALVDAQLGVWANMGVALHLRAGSQLFVLGGRDRRLAPTTRLDVPPVQSVDAWLPVAQFDELLAVGGASSALPLRGPAVGEPTRCLLYPNPYLAEEFGSFGFLKHIRFQRKLAQPSVIVDVDGDAIRVSHPDDDGRTVSASRSAVTAVPGIFQPNSVTSGDGATYDYPAITGLLLRVPGEQPIAVGCLDLVGTNFRFGWRGDVPHPNERPAFVASAADWLTLVEHFSLTSYLEDSRQPLSDNRFQDGAR